MSIRHDEKRIFMQIIFTFYTNEHPNLFKLHQFYDSDRKLYIVVEFVDEKIISLADYFLENTLSEKV
jgi:uncharacterized protein YaaR (DUF327 family)